MCSYSTEKNSKIFSRSSRLNAKPSKADPDAPTYIAKTYGQKPEDAAEWFSTVEWNYGTPMDPTMLQLVGDTLVDLRVIEKTPPSEDLVWGL